MSQLRPAGKRRFPDCLQPADRPDWAPSSRPIFPPPPAHAANAFRNGTFTRSSTAISPPISRLPADDATSSNFPPPRIGLVETCRPATCRVLQPPGIKHPGFTDFSAFDFRHRMIDETRAIHSKLPRLQHRARAERVAKPPRRRARLRHAAPRPPLAGIVIQRQQQQAHSHRRQRHRARGPAQPQLGRPFAGPKPIARTDAELVDETLRATAFLKYDFKDLRDSWGKWLGRHTLSGVWERYRRDSIATNHLCRWMVRWCVGSFPPSTAASSAGSFTWARRSSETTTR